MKTTITEKKNSLEGMNSRLKDTRDWISKLEDKATDFTQTTQNEKKNFLSEDNLRDIWYNIK